MNKAKISASSIPSDATSEFYLIFNVAGEVMSASQLHLPEGGFVKVVPGIFESGELAHFTHESASQFLTGRAAKGELNTLVRVEAEYSFMADNDFQEKERRKVLSGLTEYQRQALGL